MVLEIRQRYQALNLVRLFLALLVTWSHCFSLTGSAEPIGRAYGIATGGSIAVISFFFISGLLITVSWQAASNLKAFVVARVLRIWPALVLAVILSITLALVTSQASFDQLLLGVRSYVTHNLTLLSGVEYLIPGAFSQNPIKGSVNGSLWTLPWELRVYILVVILGLAGVLSRRRIANLVLVATFTFLVLTSEAGFSIYDNPGVPYMLGAFLTGMLVAVNRDFFNAKNVLIFFTFLVALLLYTDGFKKWVLVFLLATIIMAVSVTSFIRLPDAKNDLSYGTYVYSFPIQQFIVWMMPGLQPMALFALTLPVVLTMAYFSWQLVESPAIEFSKLFKKRSKTMIRQQGA